VTSLGHVPLALSIRELLGIPVSRIAPFLSKVDALTTLKPHCAGKERITLKHLND
jgi:hypothetical protein